jgi:hypothetical protein
MIDEEMQYQKELARQSFAKCVAMVVRNAMEDFHTKHLSDEQMRELNPIIRNAIYTASYAFDNMHHSDKAEQYIMYHMSMIPPYWEDCEFLTDLSD